MARNYLFGLFALTIPQSALGNSFSLPLVKKTSSGISLPPRLHGHWGTAQASEINEQNFWFANFTVGTKSDLSLLIDTGSTDVYLNPGDYVPSKFSIDTHINFTITFATTNPDGSGTETIDGPVYKDIVALDETQLSVLEQSLGAVPVPSFPNDGLVGFAGIESSALNSTSWFQSLCSQGSLDYCRFGLAFETDDTGVQYFGKVEYERFLGPLSTAPLYGYGTSRPLQWYLYGDIAANGKVIERDAIIVTDSGTTVIFGPIDAVQALFDAAGIQSVLHPSTAAGVPTTLDGYFPCAHPPQLGFGFPSISNATSARSDPSSPVSHFSTIFNILPSQLAENSTDGNCTASIHGTDEFGAGSGAIWIVGQAFFQGRYIDHNLDDFTMGFANLVGY